MRLTRGFVEASEIVREREDVDIMTCWQKEDGLGARGSFTVGCAITFLFASPACGTNAPEACPLWCASCWTQGPPFFPGIYVIQGFSVVSFPPPRIPDDVDREFIETSLLLQSQATVPMAISPVWHATRV